MSAILIKFRSWFLYIEFLEIIISSFGYTSFQLRGICLYIIKINRHLLIDSLSLISSLLWLFNIWIIVVTLFEHSIIQQLIIIQLLMIIRWWVSLESRIILALRSFRRHFYRWLWQIGWLNHSLPICCGLGFWRRRLLGRRFSFPRVCRICHCRICWKLRQWPVEVDRRWV